MDKIKSLFNEPPVADLHTSFAALTRRLFSLRPDEETIINFAKENAIDFNERLGFCNQTVLHHALGAYSETPYLKICDVLLRNDLVDIDRVDTWCKTALFWACETDHMEWIHYLLMQGADPRIAHRTGILPLTAFVCSEYKGDDKEMIAEILYEYTFDGDRDRTMDLTNVIFLLSSRSPVVLKIFDDVLDAESILSEGLWDLGDFENLWELLLRGSLKSDMFEMFLEKFRPVVEQFLKEFDVLAALLKKIDCAASDDNLKILNILRENGFSEVLVKNYRRQTSKSLNRLVLSAYQWRWPLKNLTEIVLDLLSYGYPHEIMAVDLNLFCEFYGYCSLYKILLIHIMEVYQCHHVHIGPLMSTVAQSVNHCFSDVLFYNFGNFCLFEQALGYFRSPRLKELCLQSAHESVLKIVEATPKMPSLKELARNATRMHYSKKFKVETLKEFAMCLKKEQIGLVYERIILLESRIYCD